MVSLLIFIIALGVLYFLSRIFIHKLLIALYRLVKSKEKASLFLGLIFLPGTFVHEISHFLMALILFIPVGQINLIPEMTEDEIRLGSVEVGKTDFLRGTLIGLAPVIAGGGIIFWAISYSLKHSILGSPALLALMIYIIFQITHTMFSSKRDLHAVLELIVFLAVTCTALVLLKIQIPFTYLYQEIIIAGPFIQKLSYFLFIPIGLELIFLLIFGKVKT